MQQFDYKEIYEEDGRRILEINILPEKYCNFDCIFCPIGRSRHKTDTPVSFGEIDACLDGLLQKIEKEKPDLVFINSKGEALVHEKLAEIITSIKGSGVPVRLLSNGYLYGREEYMRLADMCEEVIGELKVITQDDFKKVQRPVEGYTLESYIEGMACFQRQYQGTFILEITIIKGYNDDDWSVQKLKNAIDRIAPDKTLIEKIDDKRFEKKLGVTEQKLREIAGVLISCDSDL